MLHCRHSRVRHRYWSVAFCCCMQGVLPLEEVKRRVTQFTQAQGPEGPLPLVLTRAPLFTQKAALLRNTKWVNNGGRLRQRERCGSRRDPVCLLGVRWSSWACQDA